MPQPETRAGSFPTRSFTGTSTTLSGRSIPSCTVAACTNSWLDYWPTADQDPSAPTVIVEYAQLWKPVPKVVFSSTLETVDWNSRLVRGDPVAEVARLKAQPGRTMGVGGLVLASTLASAGLIDEYRLYYVPILLGSGKAAFSQIQNRVTLKPVETRTFSSGTVLLRCVPVSA